MNFYSVLDDSDDEETPKVATKTAPKSDKESKLPAAKPQATAATGPANGNKKPDVAKVTAPKGNYYKI